MIIVTQTPAHPHYSADANSLDITATPTSSGFGSYSEIDTNVTNGTVPEGTSGCWVLLVGQGAAGTTGNSTNIDNQTVAGGDGGGGGARVGIVFVDASLLGATYSVNRSSSPTSFSSGSVSLSAGWGSSWVGGTASASGITAPLANGGNGSTANSGAGGSSTGGAGGGGGGGGSAKAGSYVTGQGGNGGSSTGGSPTGQGGAGAAGGNGSASASIARGGAGGAGGGHTAASGRTGVGASYSYVLWV